MGCLTIMCGIYGTVLNMGGFVNSGCTIHRIVCSDVNTMELIWTLNTNSSQEPVNSVHEGFKKARETDYIFFYGGAIVAFEANKKPCDLQIVGEQLFSFGYVLFR